MNATATKEQRRNIRRAIGADSLAVLERQATLLQDAWTAVETEKAERQEADDKELDARLKLAGEQRTYVDREDRATRDALVAFRDAPFPARVKWLLTGKIPRPGFIV